MPQSLPPAPAVPPQIFALLARSRSRLWALRHSRKPGPTGRAATGHAAARPLTAFSGWAEARPTAGATAG